MHRFFRFFLRSLPRRFRAKYGRELEIDFAEAWAARRGRWARLTLCFATLVDGVRLRFLLWNENPREVRTPPAKTGARVGMMESSWLDAKLACRSLQKRWGFSLLALTTLGLGIGAVTAVFSILNGVLLRPLPYGASDRIAIIWHDLGNGAQTLPALNPLDYFDYRERSERFEAWTLATGTELILGETENPELVDVGRVASNFFEFFGTAPRWGRSFTELEDAPGGPHVAILSHRLWSRRFGSDPRIVGRTVRLGGEDHEVVGVLPPSFRLLLPPEAFRLRDAEIYVPVQIDRKKLPPRNYTGFTAFGRLRPGVSFEQAQQEMDSLEAQLKEEQPVHKAANLQVRAVPLHGDVVKRARPTLEVLMAAVAFVLLIVCGNTAQLLLTRWRGGERELSMRAAMGASRWRLGRLVVLESLFLALSGGVLGLGLARLAIAVLPSFAAGSVPRLEDVVLDQRVLAFALAASFVAALVFSLIPALSLSRANLAGALAEASRGSGSKRQAGLRNLLIGAEVAISVVLLVATGLTVRSFQALLEADPGFRARGLLTLRLSVPPANFPDPSEREAFYRELRDRLLTLPGVVSVAGVNQLPLTGSGSLQPYAYDEETAKNWESVTADERFVTPGFLATMGATLLEGREFTEDDIRLGRRYSVIDEALAEKVFPEGKAIGGQIRIEPLGNEDPYTEVIGVVSSLRLLDLTHSVLPQFYFPLDWWWNTSVVVRTDGDPAALAEPVREQIRELVPGAAIEDVAPMARLVSNARSQARLSLLVMLAFGAFAVVLASVGLFGVVSYAVSQRRTELGIRMALGATPVAIRRAILLDGVRLVATATVVGLAAAAALAHSMSGFLYGVEPRDPWTYAAVSATLVVVALAACWIPALRATRVDPAKVLRAD